MRDKVKTFDRLAGFWSILAAICLLLGLFTANVSIAILGIATLAVSNTYWILADIVMIKREMNIKPE